MNKIPGAFMVKALAQVLDSDSVRGAVARKIGRYAELIALGYEDGDGLVARIVVRGFSEHVRICLRRLTIAADGSWVIPLEMEADKEGVDALLKDLVLGRRFEVPEKARMYLVMLKKFLPDG